MTYPYPENATHIGYDDGMGHLTLAEIRGLFERTKTRFGDRDSRMQNVLAVRQGRMRDVYPDLFPEGPFDRGIVANMVDVAARDLAEVLAPLPTFNCSSASMASDAARKFADRRTKIVNGYLDFSDVQRQMYTATDRYFLFTETGDLVIARLTPEGYAELSRAHLLEPTNNAFGRPVVWCAPAYANTSIVVRNDAEIIRVSLAE